MADLTSTPRKWSEQDILGVIERGRQHGLSEDEIWSGLNAHPEVGAMFRQYLQFGGTEDELKGLLLQGPRKSAPVPPGRTNWKQTYQTPGGPLEVTPEWKPSTQVMDAMTFGHGPQVAAGLASLRAGHLPWSSEGPLGEIYPRTRDALAAEQAAFEQANPRLASGLSAVGEALPIVAGVGGVNSLLARSMAGSGSAALRLAAPFVSGTAWSSRGGVPNLLARLSSRATSGALQGVEGDWAGHMAHMGDNPPPAWAKQNMDVGNTAALGAAINTALGLARWAGPMGWSYAKTVGDAITKQPVASAVLALTQHPLASIPIAIQVGKNLAQGAVHGAATAPAKMPMLPLVPGIIAERGREPSPEELRDAIGAAIPAARSALPFAQGGEVPNLLQPYMLPVGDKPQVNLSVDSAKQSYTSPSGNLQPSFASGGGVEELRQRLYNTLPGDVLDSGVPVEVNPSHGASVYSGPEVDSRETLQSAQDPFADLADSDIRHMSLNDLLATFGGMAGATAGVKIPRTFRAKNVLDTLARGKFKGTLPQLLKQLQTGGVTQAELVHHGLIPHSSDVQARESGVTLPWENIGDKSVLDARDPAIYGILGGDPQPWYRRGGIGSPTKFGQTQLPRIGGAPYEMVFGINPEPGTSITGMRFPYIQGADARNYHFETPGQLFHQRGLAFFDPANARHGGGQQSMLVDEFQSDPAQGIREFNTQLRKRSIAPSFKERFAIPRQIEMYDQFIRERQDRDARLAEQEQNMRNSVSAQVFNSGISASFANARMVNEARAHEYADNRTLLENKLLDLAREREAAQARLSAQRRSLLGSRGDEWVRWNMAEAARHAAEQGMGGLYLSDPRVVAENHNLPLSVAEKLYGPEGALGALNSLARDYGGTLERRNIPLPSMEMLDEYTRRQRNEAAASAEYDNPYYPTTYLPLTPSFVENLQSRGLPWFYADGGRVIRTEPADSYSIYSSPPADTRETLRPASDPFEGLTDSDLRQLSPSELLAAMGGVAALGIRAAPLKGMFYRPGANALMSHLRTGTRLALMPEPSNAADPNAVKVLLNPGPLQQALIRSSMPRNAWLEYLQSGEPFHLGYIDKRFAPSVQQGLLNYPVQRRPYIDPVSGRLHFEGKTPYVLMEDSEP